MENGNFQKKYKKEKEYVTQCRALMSRIFQILVACLQNTIGNLVITHKDRLCRFGYELIEQMVTKAGGRIIVLEQDHKKSGEQELSDDLLSIVQVFCCLKMGKRKYRINGTKNSQN
jgi:putative resolvase